MQRIFRIGAALTGLMAILGTGIATASNRPSPRLELLGTYSAGVYNQGASEIVDYDPASKRLFTVNGATSTIDVISLANPSVPSYEFSISLAAFGRQANSVAIRNGIVAAAVEANVKTDNGRLVFFDTSGNYLNDVAVGALPDMVTFTPDGKKVLVANEGEPNNDYTIDPEGSVTIVDIRAGVANAVVRTADFSAFNSATLDPSVRIFGPGATVAQDLEPEYITVSDNSRTAWVTLQENNALAVIDLRSATVRKIVGLGFKDHNLPGNGLDPSDRDSAINIGININNWPVLGMYQPDGIASFKYRGRTFLVTANEGDAREYTGTPGYVEEARVSSLTLDPVSFPDAATLQNSANLGRLNVSRASGNGGDADYEALYSFGARSFSIWNSDGEQVFDSGDFLERLTSDAYPLYFNASNTNNTKDDRSDNKGPEPEGIAIGEVFGRTYAFIGLERIGGIVVVDVTRPYAPEFVQYLNNRNFLVPTSTVEAGDLGPEGVHFVPERESPTRKPLVIVANEISGSTSVYEFRYRR